MGFNWGGAGAGAASGATAGSAFGPWGTAIGGVAGGLFGGFSHPDKAYKDAQKQLERAWQEAKGIQQPYVNAGMGQLPMLQGAEKSLLDPSSLLADWMQKYQTSPYAQKSMQNAQASGMDAASSMGLSGSSSAVQNIQNSSSDIMNKDRSEFLKDLMTKYMTGIGVGQDIYGKGAGMAESMGKQRMGLGEDTARSTFGAGSANRSSMMDMLSMAAKFHELNKDKGK